MKTFIAASVVGGLLAGLMVAGCSRTPASAGPNGGDLVPIKGGTAYAELLANADTGEVMVHTWDKDLKSRRPIEDEPITVGSGANTVELMPHPMDGDSAGACSRFYGEANWVRGGGVRDGWMHGGGAGDHKEFAWQRCWQGGRTHSHMWEDMGEHRHMGAEHGPHHGATAR
ncbi:MAG: hypothetical protein HYX69_21185 [Planctomycetia bacterium]|nr:hypothetical protein [Planctomycetia bacterium]